MYNTFRHGYPLHPAVLCLLCCCSILLHTACSKDEIQGVYQPEELSGLRQLKFSNGSDSSIYIFDAAMTLVSGRGNTAGSNEWQESFEMKYQDKLLTGAEYQFPLLGRDSWRTVSYARNSRNMLSNVDGEDMNRSISCSYDDRYRLTQIFDEFKGGANRYTIAYDDRSNVSSVELYRSMPTGTYTKWEYGDYDTCENPFRFLVNVFYAPVFSSKYGPVRYDAIPLGMLLSVNNPREATRYERAGDGEYPAAGAAEKYSYTCNDDRYPVRVDGAFSLTIEYDK
jgi:hypothetical protein